MKLVVRIRVDKNRRYTPERRVSSMPSIKASIPDKDVKPVLDFIDLAREHGIKRLSYEELIECLLAVQID